MKPLVVLALCCVCLVLGYAGATEVYDRKATRWLARADSLTVTLAVRDAELAQMDAEAARWRVIAETPDTVTLPKRRPVPIPRTTVPNPRTVRTVQIETSGFDSLTHYKSLTDTLLREQGQLHDRIGRDAVKLQAFARIVAVRDSQVTLLKTSNDSLRALVTTAPLGHKRGVSILGFRLCPQWGVGYGLTADGRHGPVLAVVQPLSCG